MSLGKAVKRVLWFELIWKLIILGLVNPLFREIYQTYVASAGIRFNQNMLLTFLDLKGGLLFLLLAGRLRARSGTLFLLCALLGGALEYGTSLWMEAIFHARWWDYAGWPGSLSGRVCLASAAAFGLAGWLLTGWAEPLLRRGLEKLPPLWRRACCRGLCLLFAADAALSLLRPNSGAGISFPV